MDAITLLERCYNTMSLAKSNIQEEQDLMDDITDFLNKEEISQEEKNKKQMKQFVNIHSYSTYRVFSIYSENNFYEKLKSELDIDLKDIQNENDTLLDFDFEGVILLLDTNSNKMVLDSYGMLQKEILLEVSKLF